MLPWEPDFTNIDLDSYANYSDIPIKLIPPGQVQLEDYNNSSSTTQYDNQNSIPLNDNSYPFIDYGAFQVTFSYFSVHINGNPGFPAGFWALNLNDNPYAYFDINSTYPEDANSYPKIFVPVLKVNTDQNNVITSIQIKWYVYNPTVNPPYTEILGDNPALQNSILHNEHNGITITVWGDQQDDEYIQPLSPEVSEVTPTKQWNYNWQNPGPNSILTIGIGFISNGISYSFNWINRARQ